MLVKLTNRGQVIADEATAREAEAEEASIVDISDAEPGSMSYTLRRVPIQMDGAATDKEEEAQST